MSYPPFGGGVLIVDTSARVRAHHPAVVDAWTDAARAGQLATCSLVTLELMFSARDLGEIREVERDQAALRDVPVTASVQRTAGAALRALASRGSAGHQRVSLVDALIAAAAQEAGIGVLHYDRHYDPLAEVLHFDNRWLAPSGSLP